MSEHPDGQIVLQNHAMWIQGTARVKEAKTKVIPVTGKVSNVGMGGGAWGGEEEARRRIDAPDKQSETPPWRLTLPCQRKQRKKAVVGR